MSNVLLEYLSNIWYIGDWVPHRYDNYNIYLKDYEKRLKQLYPLGDDMFSIDHGKNYFNFFRRLGEPFYYAMFDGDIVIGSICYIYRKIRDTDTMYICDLKFDKLIRGQNLMTKILYRSFPSCLMRTLKFYAISMNDSEPDPKSESKLESKFESKSKKYKNKILNMGQHIGKKYGVNVQCGGVLNIYSLDYEQMKFAHELVVLTKAKTCSINKSRFVYISMRNIKDIIIKYQNGVEAPLNLLHLHYIDAENISNTFANNNYDICVSPLKNHTHMFCTLYGSELANDLAIFDILPSSTATIIHHSMDNFNWELIQTCDI